MNASHRQLKWLRRGLATFAALLALAVTCGVVWGLLASLGDSIGAKTFRSITLLVAITDGVCGICLLMGTAWCFIRMIESSES